MSSAAPAPATPLRFLKLTPVMVVDAIEPCLPFWVDRLGFTLGATVPGESGPLGFAALERDGVEVMYQTQASVAAEGEQFARMYHGHSVALFIEVSDIDAVDRALEGVDRVKPRHTTFYGTTELYVREPGGNVVGFSQRTGGEGAQG